MNDFGDCETIVRNNKIVLQDKKSRNPNKIVFINPNRRSVRKILIDNCVIKDGVRCDYLVIFDSLECYVELKGSGVNHAIDQIERTINLVSENVHGQIKHCFVISSYCPLFTTKIQEVKLRFKKRYNATFVIKNHYLEYKLL